MGAYATFDAANKLIILDQVAPDANDLVSVDVKVDIYSDAKEDWRSTPELQKYEFPFEESFGGNVTTATGAVDAYYILRNDLGWRIRPYEADHDLTLTGNIYVTDTAQGITTPTVGPYTVSVRFDTSSRALVETVNSGSGLSTDQANQLADIFVILGLDPTKPLIAKPSSVTAGASIVQAITGQAETSVTVTRTT